MALEVQHSVVFARRDGGGNPCPVVLGADDLEADAMRALAARYGHETGFAFRDENGGLRLRYFVPNHEMSMCVHATVAITTVLLARGELAGHAVTARTDSGEVGISWDDATPPMVTVEQQPPQFGPPLPIGDELEPACGLAPGALEAALPVQAVSVSRPKLIVPVRRADDVHAAAPDHPRLWALCRELGTTGAYLFAPHGDGDPRHVVARQFPVDAGYPEDPATGVAAGALAAYLAGLARPDPARWIDVEIDQGDAMGRPSRLRASAYVDGDQVRRSTVTGQAELGRVEHAGR